MASRWTGKQLSIWAVIGIVALGTGWGLQLALARYHLKRFQEVHAGVFYRVAQPTEWGLRHLIEDYHVRTVVSLQLYDYRLHEGLVDPFGPSGQQESDWVASLGARMVQWPMGDEACWPWPTPWEYEAFFRLMDDPDNLPVAIHCMGGRHRTGTLAALFRMEYDRWSAEDALAEMHSFSFDECVQVQQANLRTYLPRPHPSEKEWQALAEHFAPVIGEPKPTQYEELIRRLRAKRGDADTMNAVSHYQGSHGPFAIPLAQRLADGPTDLIGRSAAHQGAKLIESHEATDAEYQMAAALVADYGTPEDQQRLLETLRAEVRAGGPVTRRYAALVAGLGNRFTQNRIPYLAVLLADERPRVEKPAQAWRYCDVAVARIAAIVDRDFLEGSDRQAWDASRQLAQAWLNDHPRVTQLAQLTPPTGHKLVKAGDGTQQEDLTRLK
ncbi:MAG: tyrosine-protein phosphatase [Planctomycetes bacterium]|nr:tyrosine-protein phosphatase [Planctomycetota bacterium]